MSLGCSQHGKRVFCAVSPVAVVCFALLFPDRAVAQFFQQGAKLVASGANGSAQVGNAVALSADGNTAITGGSGDRRPAGAAGSWGRSKGGWPPPGPSVGWGAGWGGEHGGWVGPLG